MPTEPLNSRMPETPARVTWLPTTSGSQTEPSCGVRVGDVLILAHKEILSVFSTVISNALSCASVAVYEVDEGRTVPVVDLSGHISSHGLELCLRCMYGDTNMHSITDRPDLLEKVLEAADFLNMEAVKRHVASLLMARAATPPLLLVSPPAAPSEGTGQADAPRQALLPSSVLVTVLQLVSVASRFGITAFCDLMVEDIKRKVGLGQVCRLSESELDTLRKAAVEDPSGHVFNVIVRLMNQGTRDHPAPIGPIRLALTGN